jgi:protease IV
MRGFFKIVFGTITGIILLFLIALLVVVIVNPGKEEFKLKENSIVEIPFKGSLNQAPADFFELISMKESVSLNRLRKLLPELSQSEKVKALYLNMNNFGGGLAEAQELRSLLSDYRSNGGKIISFSEYYSQLSYYVASVSDSIYVSRGGGVEWKGLSSQIMFFKETMEKLGVDMQIIRVGKFKSAVEPFMLTEMSEANRKQTQQLLDDIWGQMLEEISASRSVSIDSLNQMADNISIISSQDAKNKGMIDGIIYQADLKETLKEEYADVVDQSKVKVKAKSAYEKSIVAVLKAEGEIVDGQGEMNQIGGDRLIKQINKLAKDTTISAVVLYVNSPGGSALASDNIYNALKKLKKKKKLVTFMSNYAASGGYYIAANSDSIFAMENTVTGSIGVFGMMPNAKELMEDKLGLHVSIVKTNEHAQMGTIFNPLSDFEQKRVQVSVDTIYSRFLNIVANGRGMSRPEVEIIAEGRVWSGKSALDIGLVDKLGDLDDAIASAAGLAELDDYVVRTYPEEKSKQEKILELVQGNQIKESLVPSALQPVVNLLNGWETRQGVIARSEYLIHIE